MELDVLKSLLAVAETGSFSRAGTRLCVSQSAVSKRIKLLEETLNLPLFDRSGPVLQLTAAGRVVERNARAMLEICTRCTAELAVLRGEKKIDFRCTPSYGISCLPLVTKALMEQRPDITNYSISLGNLRDVVDAIKSGACQLAVVEHCDMMPIPDEYILEQLNDDQLTLVGAPTLQLPFASLSLDELLHQTLYVRSVGCCSRTVLEAKMQQHGYSLDSFDKVLVCDDLNMILQSLRAGLGVGYLAQGVVADELQQGSLVKLDLPGFAHVIHRSLLAGTGFVGTEESQDLIRIIRTLAAAPLAISGCLAPIVLHALTVWPLLTPK